jgi:hypothetical protein
LSARLFILPPRRVARFSAPRLRTHRAENPEYAAQTVISTKLPLRVHDDSDQTCLGAATFSGGDGGDWVDEGM